jgi:hypothetical protein
MGIGSVVNILVCQPRQDGGLAVAPCGTDASTNYQPQVMRAYVVDPANAGSLDTIAEPFDYAQAATLWSFGFTSVLLCWFVARGAGTLLGLIRRG